MVLTRGNTERRPSHDKRRLADSQPTIDKSRRGSIDKGGRVDSNELRQQRRQQALDAVLEKAEAESQHRAPHLEIARNRRRKSREQAKETVTASAPSSRPTSASGGKPTVHWHHWVLGTTSTVLGLPASASNAVNKIGSDDVAPGRGQASGLHTRRRSALDLSRAQSTPLAGIGADDGDDMRSGGARMSEDEPAASRNPSNEWNFSIRRAGPRRGGETQAPMITDEYEDHFLPPELEARSALFAGKDTGF